jgi:hypothetical protein
MTPLFLEIFNVSDDICDSLIDIWKWSNKKSAGATSGGVTPDVKESIDLTFYGETTGYPPPQILKYIVELQVCLDKYTHIYPYCIPSTNTLNVEGVNIQYYPPGGGFKRFHNERHLGRLPYSARHLVFMTYLNTVEDREEYQGGSEWLHQSFRTKAIKGNTVLWPADWTFTHRGIIAPHAEKYIATGWLSFTE